MYDDPTPDRGLPTGVGVSPLRQHPWHRGSPNTWTKHVKRFRSCKPMTSSAVTAAALAPQRVARSRLTTLEQAVQTAHLTLEEAVPLLTALLLLPIPERYPSLTLSPQRQKQKTQEALLQLIVAEQRRPVSAPGPLLPVVFGAVDE